MESIWIALSFPYPQLSHIEEQEPEDQIQLLEGV